MELSKYVLYICSVNIKYIKNEQRNNNNNSKKTNAKVNVSTPSNSFQEQTGQNVAIGIGPSVSAMDLNPNYVMRDGIMYDANPSTASQGSSNAISSVVGETANSATGVWNAGSTFVNSNGQTERLIDLFQPNSTDPRVLSILQMLRDSRPAKPVQRSFFSEQQLMELLQKNLNLR